MESMATMQQVAYVRAEIFTTIESRITKVLEHVDEQYKSNQKTYSEAIGKAFVCRSVMI